MLSVAQKKSLEAAVTHYQQYVDQVGPYLATRGITKDAAVTRRLGFVAPGEALVGHEMYEGRLVIPYLSPTGPTDIRFRSIDPDEDGPKYMGRPGVETTLYGVLAFQTAGEYIAICEGEIDALVLQELVGIPAVGLPGANSWKSYYWRAFEDYDRVYVFADGDQAGKDMARKIVSAIDRAVAVQMPEGHDVNSVYLEYGADYLLEKAGLA